MTPQEEESVGKATRVQAETDVAFVFSLIAGILISIGSVLGVVLVGMGRPFFFWGRMGGGGMMGGNYYRYMMGEDTTALTTE